MIGIKNQLERSLKKTIAGNFPHIQAEVEKLDLEIAHSTEEKFGDYSTTVAMKLAPLLRQDPLEIGRKILSHGKLPTAIAKAMVVAPGFINFFLNHEWLSRQVARIVAEGKYYGSSELGSGSRVMVEFISANPTGPLHVGNGRGAFWGDCLSRLLKFAGFSVRREYYINDIGHQVEILAESVTRRYFQWRGIHVDYPEYCYQGNYIRDLARELTIEKTKLKNIKQIKTRIKNKILSLMIRKIKDVLDKTLKIPFDNFFRESSLYRRGKVDRMLKKLQAQDLIYKQEGAFWFKTQTWGDEKDRVLVKKDGSETYFLSDIAYHWDKFVTRKYDYVINIWGADHYGYVKRLEAALKALGIEVESRFKIIIMQLVRVIEKGIEVKMSKRSGTFITLEELVSEVGLDAARYFFLTRTPDTHLDFNLDLARAKNDTNPVYYIQYAYTRICSIMKKAERLSTPARSQAKMFEHPAELKLIKELVELPDLVEEIARTHAIQQLPFYALSVAREFHNFYTQCRVIDDGRVIGKRVTVISATQQVLKTVLDLMGISAPEKM